MTSRRGGYTASEPPLAPAMAEKLGQSETPGNEVPNEPAKPLTIRRGSLGTVISLVLGTGEANAEPVENDPKNFERRKSLGTYAAETIANGVADLVLREFVIDREAKQFSFGLVQENKWISEGRMTKREYTITPEYLDEDTTDALPFDAEIAEYKFPKGREQVLCVHDWQCNAGSFKTIVDALQRRGLSVLLFDDVGHGMSEAFDSQCIFASLNLLRQFVGHQFEGGRVKMAIGHGSGSFLLRLALAKEVIKVDQLVMICPPPPSLQDQVQHKYGTLGPKAFDALVKFYKKHFGADCLEWTAAAHAKDASILNVRVNKDPIGSESSYEAWQELDGEDSKAITLSGTTHMKVLSDQRLLDEVCQFFV